MPGKSPMIYLDACVLLSYIDNDSDRAPIIEELFRRSRANEVELITSTVTRVEVAYDSTEKAGQTLDPAVEVKIDTLWAPAAPIEIVEFYDQIAVRARDLIRFAVTQGWSLKPADAIHLATAVHMQAAEMFTYDSGLPKFSEHAGLKVCEPYNPQESIPSAGQL